MHINAEQLEQLQVVLVNDDAASFYEAGSSEEKGYWYIGRKKGTDQGISENGPMTKDGDLKFSHTRYADDFVKFATENDLWANVAVYNDDGRYDHDETIKDWDHLARYLGISDLVAVSTKIPKNVANRLRFYATRSSSSVSDTVRGLIYDYVAQSIKDNAETDMFR